MLALKHSLNYKSNTIRKAFHFDRNSVCALQAVDVATTMVYKSPYSKSFSIWARNDMVPNKGGFFKYSSVALGYGDSSSMDNTGQYLWILYEIVSWNKSLNNSSMDTNWHYYCLTISGHGLPKVYIDGVLRLTGIQQDVSTSASACQYSLGNTAIGSTNRAFSGDLTRFCIFDKVLTDNEVAADFADGMNPPSNESVQTFLNMEMKNGVVKDVIGDYDMNIIGGATQIPLTGMPSGTNN